jgi:hypothetical protein
MRDMRTVEASREPWFVVQPLGCGGRLRQAEACTTNRQRFQAPTRDLEIVEPFQKQHPSRSGENDMNKARAISGRQAS